MLGVSLDQLGVIFTTVIIFLLTALYVKHIRRPKNFPPGPLGLPLVGIAPFLGSRPDKTLTEYAHKYGDIMAVDMGTHFVLVLSDVDVMNEALAKQGDHYSARPWAYLHNVVWGKHGIAMNDYNQDWKEQRKFALQSLRKFGFGKSMLEGPIVDEARFLSEALRTSGGDYQHGKNYLMDAIANVICKLTLGMRFNYDDDQSFMQYAHNVTRKFQDSSFYCQASILLPYCYLVPPFRTQLNKMKEIFSLLHETLHGYVETHINELNPNEPEDFSDDYLIEISKKPNDYKGMFNAKNLKYILRDFFLGGTETVFSTLTWAMLIATNRPLVQKKLREEIDRVIGRDGMPSFKHKDEMHYLQAFTQELLRYRTLLPFGLARMTSADTILGGYHIPKGMTVLANIYGAHNDPRHWKDPHEFRVERHLDENGQFFKNPHVIPFGVGHRYCIGKQLGEMEFFLFFVTILQNFNIESGTGGLQPEDLVATGLISTPPKSTSLKLRERE